MAPARWSRPGLVTLVVPVTDTQLHFVDECLDSLRNQSYPRLQILVVPFGAADGVLGKVRRHAAEDWRVTLLPVGATDLGGAWDRGAQRAAGEFLGFVWGADRLPLGAVEALAGRLQVTGSDLAVGRRGDAGTSSRSSRRLQARVHERDRFGTRIEDFPTALLDVGVENRLIRTAFWRRAGLRFGGAAGAVLTVPIVDTYLRASRFDVLAQVTYQDLNRGGGLPFGHLPNAMPDLPEWVDAQAGIRRALEATGSEPLLRAWLYGVLDQGALPFLDDCERATAEEWNTLVTSLSALTGRLPAGFWESVRAESKLKLWLAVHDHRAELEELVSRRWFADGNMPTHVKAGRVYAELPFWGDPDLAVPEDCFAMAPEETGLSCSLRQARWADPHTLELLVFGFASHVDMSGVSPQVRATLVRVGDGRRLEVPVRTGRDAAATRFGGHRHQNYDTGVFTVRVDARRLADERRPGGVEAADEWRLHLELSVHGLTRSGRVNHVELQGSAAALPARRFGRCRLLLEARTAADAVLSVAEVPVRLRSAAVTGRTVRGELAELPGGGPWRVAASREGGESVTAPVTEGQGVAGFELTIPEVGSTNEAGVPRAWRLQVVSSSAAEPLGWPADAPDGWICGTGDLAWRRTEAGLCELREVRHVPAVDCVRVDGEELVLGGRWLGPPPPRPVLRLHDHRNAVESAVEGDGARFTCRVPLRASRWQFPAMPLPTGTYRLQLRWARGAGEAVVGDSIVIDDTLRQQLPVEQLGDTQLVRAFRQTNGRLTFRLSAPLTDEERGPWAQQQLQDALQASTRPLDPTAVYLQSYAGQSATDSQLAIHEELRRRGAPVTLYWGVSDYSSAVPEGGIPVLIKSRRWYDVLATAGHLVNNIDFDRWWCKRPGQRLLQTFHGYPAKAMGVGLWEAKQFTPRRIEQELERTTAGWDLILTPDPAMDRYYRREYRYDGAIHSKGYPRDDVLVSPEAAEVRSRTRARLGLREDQTAVLYAPTWREHLAVSYRSARLVRHLDLETASEALGDDFVLLMRGHRFHAKAAQRADETARVLDVTDYPEINDLILAADVAVLDYSSLRFDFALTGKPMLFLVPDLHMYTGGLRGFLYDYRETAPGPLLDTADEVVERLRDLDQVRAEYAAAEKEFNERFQQWHDGHAAERVVDAFFDLPGSDV